MTRFSLFLLTRFTWQFLSCRHRLQFAHPHRQEGCHKFPPTLRVALKKPRSGCLPVLVFCTGGKETFCALDPCSLSVSVCLPFMAANEYAATSVFLTLLLGQPKGLVARRCPLCLQTFGVDGSSPQRCVCKDTGEGRARDKGPGPPGVGCGMFAQF